MSVFELVTGDTINAYDSGFAAETPSGTHPLDGFDNEDGPNRFTIWIPSEQVVVNMGNPVRGVNASLSNQEQTHGQPLVDAGFVVQTDNHIHFHTFGFPTEIWPGGAALPEPGSTDYTHPVMNASERTVVRIGTPSSVVKAGSGSSSYGSKDNNALKTPVAIGSVYPSAYNAWDGYAMVTEGGSYQEAWGNNVIVSGNADVRIAGQRSVLIGSPSDVHIMASGPDSLATIVSNTNSGDDFQGDGYWVDEQLPLKKLDAFWAALSLADTAVNTALSFAWMQYSRPAMERTSGWKGFYQGTTLQNIMDVVGAAGSLIAPAAAIYSAYSTFKGLADSSTSTASGPQSSVTVYGSQSVNLFGAVTAGLHSEVSTSVSSALSTSVSSTATTSVSSLISTSVSGASTAISGMLSASMSSLVGSVTVTGKTSAQFSSWGQVFVTGNQDVQVNSNEGQVFLHGSGGFYLGCGTGAKTPVMTGILQTGTSYAPGPGYGIQGSSNGITIAAMTQANVFASPTPDPANPKQILVMDDKIVLQYKLQNLTIDDSGISIVGKSGQRIQLG